MRGLLVDAWSDDDVHPAVVVHRDMINGSLHCGEVSEPMPLIDVDGRQGSDLVLRSVEHGMVSFPYRLHPHEELILQQKCFAGLVGCNRGARLLWYDKFSRVASC